jgi:DNA-binding PucR family transcriptional regulator
MWDRPSPRVAELIRTAVEQMLANPDELFGSVDEGTLANASPAITADPMLVDAIKRTNRANLTHWAMANLRDPGARVEPNLGGEVLGIARDLVRRGLDDTSLDTYRAGQNVAWRLWMQRAFTLTSDPDELRELLDVSARSIFAFVDETIAGIARQIEAERERLTQGTNAERLEVVALILEGAPIKSAVAEARLGYALDRSHTAAILFSDDQGALAQAAEAVASAAGARRPFSVVASASSLWTWVPGEDGPSLDALRDALTGLPDVRLALGTTAFGLEGFRRSHLDALATQRLLLRSRLDVQLATFDEVEVVALATQDEERAQELVDRTLGPLATAPDELRETLRVYLREECNATRAAKALYAHRNTVLNRLAKAEELLPAPLAGRSLQVGLALEIVRWIGARG